jgi:hypothetical protein
MVEHFNDKFQVKLESLIKTLLYKRKKIGKSINIPTIYQTFSSFKFKDELFLMCRNAV